jgi:hypothetical protein
MSGLKGYPVGAASAAMLFGSLIKGIAAEAAPTKKLKGYALPGAPKPPNWNLRRTKLALDGTKSGRVVT